jgi:Schlafen group 3, DNA/RNA helicase domain
MSISAAPERSRRLNEFGCQGLELDYVGLCWRGDLIWREDAWTPRQMRAPRRACTVGWEPPLVSLIVDKSIEFGCGSEFSTENKLVQARHGSMVSK